MDCEKFESTLIDELYDELDDLTSAEAKRHASGCSRCGGLLAGLRATRKVALLPMIAPPDDMEERILTAAREAQKVVPFKTRLQRMMARAGNWAMRPQTAMAAVFLLAIGSSFVFMRSRDSAAPASVKVKAEGAPAPVASAAATATAAPLDPNSAFGAHGTEEKKADMRSRGDQAQATDLPNASTADLDGVTDNNRLGGSALAKDKAPGYADDESARLIGNAAAPAGAPPPPMQGAASEAQSSGGGGGGGGVNTAATGGAGPVDFNTAMNAYRARRFEEAARGFDGLSSTDVSAALWAARSIREARGCGAAVARFDAVNTRAFGTANGYEAALDAGRCYRDIGNYAMARARLSPLLGVPAYAERAQEELDGMAPQAKKPAAAPRAMSPAPAATPNATTKAGADQSF